MLLARIIILIFRLLSRRRGKQVSPWCNNGMNIYHSGTSSCLPLQYHRHIPNVVITVTVLLCWLLKMFSSPPSTPNFSRPFPSPYNNMGSPTRQPRATSADQVASRHDIPPRTSSARQLNSENRLPLSASLPQPSGIHTAQKTLLPRKMNSIQDLASRSPVPPAPTSAGGRIIGRKIERKVSFNDLFKEQWQPQMSTLSFSREHPPIIEPRSKMSLRRQTSFPSHERQISKDSKVSDKSDRTIVQKMLSRKPSNSLLPPRVTTKDELGNASGDSTVSHQTVVKYPAILQPK